MADHDKIYKKIFTSAEMIADLLLFVHEDWVQELDKTTLEKVGGEYVSDDLRHRECDVVWRLRWGKDRWLYVYVLLEFQSTVDPFMALRLMVYVGLLWQDLVRQKVFTPEGKLPPVLPIVLYNGDVPWGAAQEVSELIAEVPGGLERYRPRLQYFLLDEKRLAGSELESLRNLAGALFRLEQDRGPEDFQRVWEALGELLADPSMAELRRAFLTFARVYLKERLPGIELPEFTSMKEVTSMLSQRVVTWPERWMQEGFEKGIEKGIEEGRHEARRTLQDVLLRTLESRFGTVPDEVRRRVEALRSVPVLADLIARAGAAPSLEALGLS